MWKQFRVVRVGNTVDINFETLHAEFGAEVIDVNASAAFDWRATRYTDREFWNWLSSCLYAQCNKGVQRSR